MRRIIDDVGSARTGPRIFISYRRDDAAGEAGRLADHLSRRFGTGAVFLDIETIDPGTDFVSVLQTTLAQTAAVLVIVGTRWISLRGASGTRRLDDEHDFVRLEVDPVMTANAVRFNARGSHTEAPRHGGSGPSSHLLSP